MPLDTWLEQLRRGGLDLAILATVSSGPRYGLAIIQHLEAFTDLVVTEGTIYPILGRLTREGLLEASWVNDESAHPRKYYRLTAVGANRLGTMTVEWHAFTSKIARLLAAAGAPRGETPPSADHPPADEGQDDLGGGREPGPRKDRS